MCDSMGHVFTIVFRDFFSINKVEGESTPWFSGTGDNLLRYGDIVGNTLLPNVEIHTVVLQAMDSSEARPPYCHSYYTGSPLKSSESRWIPLG